MRPSLQAFFSGSTPSALSKSYPLWTISTKVETRRNGKDHLLGYLVRIYYINIVLIRGSNKAVYKYLTLGTERFPSSLRSGPSRGAYPELID